VFLRLAINRTNYFLIIFCCCAIGWNSDGPETPEIIGLPTGVGWKKTLQKKTSYFGSKKRNM